jgi:hypothetical protein
MLARSRHSLMRALAAVLILGTAVGPSAMALGSARSSAATAHHHHRDNQPPASQSNSCCEFCWTACATAPGMPIGARLAPPVVHLLATSLPVSPGRHAPVPVPHILPFSQGPPTLLV